MIMKGNAPTLISGVPNVACSLAMDQVTGERHAERAGQHVAVRSADGGLAQLADQAEHSETAPYEMTMDQRNVSRKAAHNE